MTNKANVKRRPKQGKCYVALVVGIRLELYSTLKQALAKIGVYLKYTWTLQDRMNLGTRPIPDDVDVTIVVREHSISLEDRNLVMAQAKRKNWALDPAVGVQPTIRALESQGFDNMEPIILDEIEGRDPGVSNATRVIEHPAIAPTPAINHPRLVVVAPPLKPESPKPDPVKPGSVKPVKSEPAPTGTPRLKDRPLLQAYCPTLVEDGHRLRAARIKADYRIMDLEKIIGVSGSTFSAIEAGRGACADDILEALERLYGISVGTFPRRSQSRHNPVARHAINTRSEFLPKTPSGLPAPVVLYEPTVDELAAEAATETTPTVVVPVVPIESPKPVEAPPRVEARTDEALTERDVMILCSRLKGALRALKVTSITITRKGISVESEDEA